MPRIAGVDIPLDKQIRISLRYLYGIGPVNAMEILKEAGIDPMKKARELNEDEVGRIVNIIDRSHVVEGALRRQVQQNIQRLKDIVAHALRDGPKPSAIDLMMNALKRIVQG